MKKQSICLILGLTILSLSLFAQGDRFTQRVKVNYSKPVYENVQEVIPNRASRCYEEYEVRTPINRTSSYRNENTIGVKPGYNIAGEKGFTVTVNRRSHLLDIKLTENAWTFSDKQDVVMLNEMLDDGRSVKIRGYDHAGNVSIDYYSLRGLNYVLQYFNNNCSASN